MLQLPEKLLAFGKWWIWNAPKHLFKLSQVILILLNNEFSFTLNLRLMFTPLFGDYTFMGRFIGFIFRFIEIIFGSLILLILWILSFFIPVVWWLLPILILIKIKLLLLPITLVVFLVWLVAQKNTPEKRVQEVSQNKLASCFRPKALTYTNQPEKLYQDPTILLILKKAELLTDTLITELAHAAIQKAEVIKKAYDYAVSHKTRYVEPEHVFLAVLATHHNIDNVLSTYGGALETLEQTIKWVVAKREDLAKVYFWQKDYEKPIMGGIGKGMTGRVTPALNSVSEDFTRKVKKGLIKKIIGREQEIKEIADILSGSKVNVLIIGEPGSGKTSIVKGIAYKIVRGTEYKSLKFKRIVSLDIGAMLAGTKSPGDVAAKLNKIIEEIDASNDIILFIDEIHNLVSEEANIFSILEPHLASDKIQFIGATSIENYRKHIEPNGSFARLFQLVEIPQAGKEDTLEILKYVACEYERDYKIVISLPALKKVIELSEKLVHERVLPDKAIDILNRTAVSISKATKFVTAEDIAKEISEMTHVPVTAVTQDESQKLLNIEKELAKRVIGQDDAINQVGAALKRARVGIRNENKPIASFLFVGTTGVGKTETAKALAQTYFGDSKAMIRLDMSEYQQADSINRLIGSPDGASKGILTEAVRSKPFSLILLDEIEKAYSNVLLTFLQVLDDGRITDSTGRVIDFDNTIIIATSNVGTRAIQEIAGQGGTFDQMQEATMKEVRTHFAPEFLNRFNGIIVFKPLNIDSVRKICNLMLGSVRQLAENKGIKINFKPELVDELIKRGYNPEWGARPLARTIENSVESYLAVKLLANGIKQGDSLELGLEVFS